MTWKIEFDPKALAELERLDRQVQCRIVRILRERIAPLEDPRSVGEALRGKDLGRFWKYRIGDYGLICDIQDDRIRILVLRIENRKEIYR